MSERVTVAELAEWRELIQESVEYDEWGYDWSNVPQPKTVLRLIAEVEAQVADITKLREALSWFVDDEPCSLDHHGYCQEHLSFDDPPCFMVKARDILASTDR